MFLTQILNGKTTELSLCESCAEAKGLYDPHALSLAEKFFPELIRSKKLHSLVESETSGTDSLTVCPCCCMSIHQVRSAERFGCSHCYSIFADELLPTGNVPENNDKALEDIPEKSARHAENVKGRTELEAELKIAISREDYERAAQLRDSISQLKDIP